MKKLPCKKTLIYYTNPYMKGEWFAYYRNRRWHLRRGEQWGEFPAVHLANSEHRMFERIRKAEVTVVPASEVRIPLPKELYKGVPSP